MTATTEPETGDNARPDLSRRHLIGAGLAGVATAGVLGQPAAATPLVRRRATVDAVVVGAGLAGLNAATRLRQHGHSVAVLEAQDRVGGRNFDVPIAHGKIVELGGEWTGPGQHRVRGLARHLGVKTFVSYAKGKNLYYRDGKTTQYDGDIPPANAASLGELEATIIALNQMAGSVSANRPWAAPDAPDWDRQTIAQWSRGICHLQESRDLVDIAVRSVYGDEPDQISLLDLLAAITGVGGDFNTLIGSAQSIRFVGGPQQLSQRLARRLGDRVHLNHRVTAIDGGHHFTVHTPHGEFVARRVILAVPKPLIATIDIRPELPAIYRQLLQRQPMGATIKVNVVYHKPFWRGQGLSGSVVADSGPIQVTYDNSPPDGHPGVIVGFLEGKYGRRHLHQSKSERRKAVIDCLVRYFGAEARHATGYHEKVWAKDRWAEGAYGSFNPPGVLTGLGPLLPDDLGGIAFAGADFSATWPGYMDGAIGSGHAAAEAVISSLH